MFGTGSEERVVETKAPGDATEFELHIREVNTGTFAFEGRALLAALEEVRSDNAQGELYLPDVLPIMRAHERTVLAHELSDLSVAVGINERDAHGSTLYNSILYLGDDSARTAS